MASFQMILLAAVFPAGLHKTRFCNRVIELCNNKCKFFIFTPLNFYNKAFHLSLSLTGIIHFHSFNFSSPSDTRGSRCYVGRRDMLFEGMPAQRTSSQEATVSSPQSLGQGPTLACRAHIRSLILFLCVGSDNDIKYHSSSFKIFKTNAGEYSEAREANYLWV